MTFLKTSNEVAHQIVIRSFSSLFEYFVTILIVNDRRDSIQYHLINKTVPLFTTTFWVASLYLLMWLTMLNVWTMCTMLIIWAVVWTGCMTTLSALTIIFWLAIVLFIWLLTLITWWALLGSTSRTVTVTAASLSLIVTLSLSLSMTIGWSISFSLTGSTHFDY